jgi:hypothetical protein
MLTVTGRGRGRACRHVDMLVTYMCLADGTSPLHSSGIEVARVVGDGVQELAAAVERESPGQEIKRSCCAAGEDALVLPGCRVAK